MAELFKRPGSPFWYAWLRDPRALDGVVKRSTKRRVKGEARSVAHKMQATLDRELGALPRPDSLWWSDASAFFLTHAPLKASTRHAYKSQVEVIKSSGLGDFALADLGLAELDAFVHERRWQKVKRHNAKVSEKRVSEATIRRNLSLLSAVIMFSIDSKLTGAPEHNIIMLFDRSKLKETALKKRNLRHDQMVRVLEACESEEQIRLIIVLVRTGIRSGELIALRWFHVNFVSKRLEFGNLDPTMTKTAEPRIVPLVDEAFEAFTAQFTAHSKRPLLEEHVFPSPIRSRAGKGRANLSGLLKMIKRKTGLEMYTNHGLRHTYASDLLQAGADPFALRDTMGHSTLSMTSRYANQVTDVVDAQIKSLDYRPLYRPVQRIKVDTKEKII